MKQLNPADYPTYNVGDTVTIRQWDDMKSEFGMNEWGSIAVPRNFTTQMKQCCGKTFTINDVFRYSYGFDIYILGDNGFYFSSPMFEQPQPAPISALSFDSLLQGGA